MEMVPEEYGYGVRDMLKIIVSVIGHEMSPVKGRLTPIL